METNLSGWLVSTVLSTICVVVPIPRPAHLNGQIIPVANPQFQVDGLSIHGKPAMPAGWDTESVSPGKVRYWHTPFSGSIALGGGASLSQVIDIPPLDPKLARECQWRLLLAIDVAGKFVKPEQASEPALLRASIHDTNENRLVDSRTFQVTHDAIESKQVRPAVLASSFKANQGKPEFAFDGDPATIWHSDWGQDEPAHPHHLTLDFGEVRTLNGFAYQPRRDGGNGTLGKFELQVTTDGAEWTSALVDQCRYQQPGQKLTFHLETPVSCRAMRLNFLSARRGDRFGSCAELIPLVEGGFAGLVAETPDADLEEDVFQRVWLPINYRASEQLEKIRLTLQVDSNRYVVVRRVHLFRAPQMATMKMRGKANGHSGPDLLGAGSYGFDALMIHDYPALPIMEVRQGTPAARAGLQNTDLIVAVNDRWLPPGNVNPGFEWFRDSHEAILGRAALDALHNKVPVVVLNVLRDNSIQRLKLELDLPTALANQQFMTDPTHSKLLNKDLLNHVIATQQSNGSWKNNPIHTCLGGLALLSTHDQQHAQRIKAAANWMMAQNAEPGTGFYWHPSFAGIFLSEYYLATGDDRVLPFIERLLNLMSSAFHTSKWGTETFGHGPRGLPYDNKSLVAVMVHVLLFETLAHRCGVDSSIYERLEPFLEESWANPADGGHGAMGYNPSYKDLAEFWSRTGLFSLSLHMRGIRPDMQKPMAEIMYQRHPWFRNSHAYGEPGGLLGLIGLSQVNPAYFEEIMSLYRWWFALAWEANQGLRFTIPHMGAPYMEGPVLINNGYAIVTNIHRKSLHITGSQQRDWLNVDNIPVPVSDVMILQNRAGEIRLRTRVPGPAIYYTTDGSEPGPNAKPYGQPFRVEPGMVVKAIAVNQSGTSEVAVRGFGLDKSKWSIVSATGHTDPANAVARAAQVMDGDRYIGWIPDQGEGARGFPHELVIDLGDNYRLELAGIRFLLQAGACQKVALHGATTAEGSFRKIGEIRSSQFAHDVQIPLKTGPGVRFIKLKFSEPFTENSNLLMVGEVDFR